MRIFLVLTTALFLQLSQPDSVPASPNVQEIMDQVYSRPKGNNSETTFEMLLTGTSGHPRIRKIKSLFREDQEKRQRLLFFIEPADVRDTAFLIDDYKEQDQKDAQWVFLPSYHKTKRIASGNANGSFMGSDFSHADLTSQATTNFNYNLIKESQVNSHPVWIIQATPKNDEIVRDYGYSKSLLLVRKDNFVVVRSVHWVLDKNILKYVEIKRLELINGIWVPMEVVAKTVKEKKTLHQTLLRINTIAFDQPFSEDLFSVKRLEQGL